MRLRDNPTIEVSIRLPCSTERAWELVTDIELPTRADGELQKAHWLDGADGVAIGARFRGYNRNPQIGEWHTEPEVSEVEDGRRWVWRVGPAEAPVTLWGFEVDADGDGTVVRQWVKIGSGTSPLSDLIAQHPDDEGTILARRMAAWRAGMSANMALLEELTAEGATDAR
ncbi:SRPBCC family protein [Tomitella cavernea]|uniref:SRPBCC family protein n=1 Tax=Tomitella cavernea TaxID=1387982 RepID=A0ABP9D343_9ACTN|nr:SRPBCC family protein [Tomitella cavernea]